MTTPELLEAWARAMRRAGLAEATIDKRRRCLSAIFADLGTSPTRAQVQAWLDGRDLSAKSRAVWLSHLNTYWVWAAEEGYAETNPVAGVKAPKVGRRLPRPVTDADLSLLLEEARDPRTRAMVALAALGGLRCCEIANLDRSDVLADRLRLLGKGNRERIVPMHPDVAAALEALPLPVAGPVFRGPGGGRLSANAVSHALGEHIHACGIAGGAHRLRHWFATATYAGTHDLRVVQELLGHASPTTTAVYTAINADGARAAVATLRTA